MTQRHSGRFLCFLFFVGPQCHCLWPSHTVAAWEQTFSYFTVLLSCVAEKRFFFVLHFLSQHSIFCCRKTGIDCWCFLSVFFFFLKCGVKETGLRSVVACDDAYLLTAADVLSCQRAPEAEFQLSYH